jgi:hypothetical protein
VPAVEGVTFETLGRWIPGFDPATGILMLPPWAVAAGAVVVGFLFLYVLARCLHLLARYLLAGGRRLFAGVRSLFAGAQRLRAATPSPSRKGLLKAAGRVALVLFGAGTAWFVLDLWMQRDLAAERRALEARAFELTARALMPGSALACLEAGAGDTVEASCEKALFATPEATATAVSYVAAQLALLADGTAFARRDRSFAIALTYLRRTVEVDRFGLVAHALAARDGCTPERCRAFELLKDPGRVRANLAERSYDFYVMRHASGWPPITKSPAGNALPPVAVVAPQAVPAAPTQPAGGVALPPSVPAEAASAQASARPGVLKLPGPNVFFPSASSIPPVSIMNNEPPTGPPAEKPAAAKSTPTPPRKPAPPATPPQTRRPVDINAATARSDPAATAQ